MRTRDKSGGRASKSTRWAGVPCPEPICGQDSPLAQGRRLRGVPTRRDRSPPARNPDPHPVLLRLVESLATLSSGRRLTARSRRRKGMQCGPMPPNGSPGRRDALETLPSGFVPHFPASGWRNVAALPRKVSSCQTRLWEDADATHGSPPISAQDRKVPEPIGFGRHDEATRIG